MATNTGSWWEILQSILPDNWQTPEYLNGRQAGDQNATYGLPEWSPDMQGPADLTDPYYRTLHFMRNQDGSISYGFPGFSLGPGQSATDNRGVRFSNPSTGPLVIGFRQQNPAAPMPGDENYNGGAMQQGFQYGNLPSGVPITQANQKTAGVVAGRYLPEAVANAVSKRSRLITGLPGGGAYVDRSGGKGNYRYTPGGARAPESGKGRNMSESEYRSWQRSESLAPENYDRYMKNGGQFNRGEIQDAINRVGRDTYENVWNEYPGSKDQFQQYVTDQNAKYREDRANGFPNDIRIGSGDAPTNGGGETPPPDNGGGETPPPPPASNPGTPPVNGPGTGDQRGNGPTDMPQVPDTTGGQGFGGGQPVNTQSWRSLIPDNSRTIRTGPNFGISPVVSTPPVMQPVQQPGTTGDLQRGTPTFGISPVASPTVQRPGPTMGIGVNPWLKTLMDQDPEYARYLQSIGAV